MLECFKTYRAFGAAVIWATQDLNDFFALESGKFGRAILNSSRIKVVFPLEDEEAVRVKEVMGLSDEEMMQVIRNKRGEGLLCAGHNRISVAFQSTQLEYDWIHHQPRRPGGPDDGWKSKKHAIEKFAGRTLMRLRGFCPTNANIFILRHTFAVFRGPQSE